MKKLLLFTLLGCSELFLSQTVMSFEASEGYEVGDLNYQKDWKVSSWGYSPSFMVSDEKATDGEMSMKIMDEELPVYNFSSAFCLLSHPLAFNNFSVSFDLNVNKKGFDTYYIENAEMDNLVYSLKLSSYGYIIVEYKDGNGNYVEQSVGNWEPNTWYNFKIIGNQNGISYYKDNVLLGKFPHGNTSSIDQIQFTKWNAIQDNDDNAYIDNIIVGEAMLSTDEIKISEDVNISIYPNPVSNILNINSRNKIELVQVYDMNGKLMPLEFKDGSMDVGALSLGVYSVSVVTSEGYYSEKFIKQ